MNIKWTILTKMNIEDSVGFVCKDGEPFWCETQEEAIAMLFSLMVFLPSRWFCVQMFDLDAEEPNFRRGAAVNVELE